MKLIHKQELKGPGTRTELDLPLHARVVSTQMQRDTICIWYEFKAGTEILEKRAFQVVGTGTTFGADAFEVLEHLGTIQDGTLVWHVYEV